MRAGLWLLPLVLILVVAGCSEGSDREVTGIVVGVEGELEEIQRFTILAEGERMTFQTSADGDYAFPPAHLRDHLRSGEPVQVRWREDGNRRTATFLDDG